MKCHSPENRLVDKFLARKQVERATSLRGYEVVPAASLRISAGKRATLEVGGRRNQNRDGVGPCNYDLRILGMYGATGRQYEHLPGEAGLVFMFRSFSQ